MFLEMAKNKPKSTKFKPSLGPRGRQNYRVVPVTCGLKDGATDKMKVFFSF